MDEVEPFLSLKLIEPVIDSQLEVDKSEGFKVACRHYVKAFVVV